jgi:predicted aldo/keto reductase-like oxidoreductase
MNYRELADTGVFVSELCLGTMTFGGRGQMWEVIGGLEQKSVDDLVHGALDAGINFVDKEKGFDILDVAKVIAGLDSLGSDRRPGERRY